MKILVAIANHGTKNSEFLKVLLEEYGSFSCEVQIVVLSDVPKDFGPGIQVRVGAPTSNPFSLPFAYKPLFIDNQDAFDLFIYTEDDMLITEENVRGFLDVTHYLPTETICGFLRYETNPEGQISYVDIHCHYHWDPASVCRHGPYTLAYCTNEHSACFILTKDQLKMAIRSGGFNAPPREERYKIRETAATDPYTKCGFRKMIPISHLKQFILPHLPNVYIGRSGLDGPEVDMQIEALMNMDKATLKGPLVDACRFGIEIAAKEYYEECRHDILDMIPSTAKTVLSVACGWGETERSISARGISVVAVPMDAVIAVSAHMRGIETTPPNHEAAIQALSNRSFDCIVFNDILEHLDDPARWIRDYNKLLNTGGCFVISAANSSSFPLLKWLFRDSRSFLPRTDNVLEENIVPGVPGRVPREWYHSANLREDCHMWRFPVSRKVSLLRSLGLPRRWLATRLVVRIAP